MDRTILITGCSSGSGHVIEPAKGSVLSKPLTLTAIYRPTHGRSVANLLAKGIIHRDGSPGPNAPQAAQFMVTPPLPITYFISTSSKTPYSPYLPTPELGGAPNHALSLSELFARVQTNPATVQPPFDSTIPARNWPR
jgi:hypothetical protein